MMAAGDPIKVEFDFADLPLRPLMRKIRSFHQPNRAVQVLVSVGGWLVLTLGILGLFQLGNGYSPDGPEFAIIGFAAGMVATVLVLMLLTRRMAKSQMAALLSARSRQGRVTIVLGADGLEYHCPGLSTRHSWESIQEVVVVQAVTMIMPSRVEFYPVPHEALPGDISPEELAKRIIAWRSVAQVSA